MRLVPAGLPSRGRLFHMHYASDSQSNVGTPVRTTDSAHKLHLALNCKSNAEIDDEASWLYFGVM